jgi:amidase
MSELWRRGAGELAGMIALREVSSAEVVDAHLDRIAAVNPQLNAITQVLGDGARAAAAEADRVVASGAPLGRLHGVPFTIKQNIDLAGSSTNWGLVALAGAIPPVDSPVVERMKTAGAVPIGRTNCPDMALRVHTDSGLYGLTRNPWNAGYTTGGS